MSYRDLVKQAATVNGTGAFTFGAAVQGFQTMNAGRAVGEKVKYKFTLGADWEVGIGTIAANSTLLRMPSASSNNGALVPFAAGTGELIETVTAAAFNEGLIDPSDAGFDIVLCAGQSNMVGLGPVVANMDIADARVFQFGSYPSETATYQKIVSGVDPLKHPFESAPGLSPASWFSKTYAGAVPSNRKVLLVPVAQGGMSLVYAGGSEVKWAPGSPGGTLYELAISQSNAAIAAAKLMYPNSRFVGALWLQGESDGDWTISTATYAAALKSLIGGFRSRITDAADSWFVIAGMVPEGIVHGNHAGFPAIDVAHKQVAAETAKCMFVAGPSGYVNEVPGQTPLHYNAQGARILGCGLAIAVPAAKRATGTVVPASAVTLTRGASTGYVGSPVTITVGTNNPLIGSQTESVQLTSNVAGTFSVNPVLLSASTLSAASVFTPSAAGSATITGTATGTPTLTAGTVTYTANALTAPAQMAAPVATAGVQSAGITLTAPNNGGSAITGYTVVSNPAGGVDSAAGTTALTRTMTGLTAGTAYTFTATATNTVGASPASPASNSVTPTAAATVPAAPTIGTAVAGNGYVDVAFTRNSNGGSAVLDSTATLSTGQTATGTASPIRVTAPNGTAVTATVKDRNAVGLSAASAASNSVTPAASGGSGALRFADLVTMTETSATPPYAYRGAGASYNGNTNNGGTSVTAMAGDGSVTIQIGDNTGKPMLGLKTQSTTVGYSSIDCIVFADPAGYGRIGTSGGVGGATGIIPAAGDLMRMSRAGTTVVAAVSKDSGTTWTTINTWNNAPAGARYAQILCEANGTLVNPVGVGFA